MYSLKFRFYILYLLFFVSCNTETNPPSSSDHVFDLMNSKSVGITFNNELTFTEEYNPYTFKNFFNGGGVGLGDFNNDNLVDIYLTGNLVENKLYLNQGNLKFKDITQSAGVVCKDVWSSGVSLVDINGDGNLDIYVCKSGRPDTEGVRQNELFINNGDLTFTENAKAYGLDFKGLAVHAVFFDYDLDGDLDCYLLNNSIRSVGGYDMIPDQRNIPNPEGGNMLLKSMLSETDGALLTYQDVTQEAGIYNSDIGFGLGVSASDLNNDGWPDLFVSNDFFEKDYLYINNQDGTFREIVDASMQELSMGSMGADIADIDNDGDQDIYVTEMLPSTLARTKSKAVFETFDKSQLNYEKGYHRQYGRNAFHLNQGVQNNDPYFSEIARYNTTEATEWSWGALIEDFDQDGLKDIFVANGIYKDLLDQDYLNFYNPNQIRKLIQSGEKNAITKMFESMPSSPYPNVFYKNQSNLQFTDESIAYGFEAPTYSNGSAYADLDNDGDLDIVTNNIGSPASVYRNNSNAPTYSILLKGKGYNTNAIGSKVTCFSGPNQYVKEIFPMKGFESTVDPRVLLPQLDQTIDSVQVQWPNNQITTLSQNQLHLDSLIVLNQPMQNQNQATNRPPTHHPLLTKIENLIPFTHQEDSYIDFNSNRTQSFFISNEGPIIEVADLNGDRQQDIIIGGSKGHASKIYLQKRNSFIESKSIQEKNITGNTTDILVQDLNGDGQKDIYLASGGIEFSQASSALKDQVYVSSGTQFLPVQNTFINSGFSSSSSVAQIDIDLDNDLDIIVAERLKPNAYGIHGDIIIYQNDKSKYSRQVPNGVFKGIGLMTDLQTMDIDGDDTKEILIATEFGNIILLDRNSAGEWVDQSKAYGLSNIKGLWNKIEVVDIDADGDLDIIAANMGLNNRISNLIEKEATLFVNDFDRNGSVETILCSTTSKGNIPLLLRDDLLMQLPILKKQVLNYNSFANATIESLFDASIIDQSITYSLNEFRSGIFINNGNTFEFKPLPKEAQLTDQRAILVKDIDRDGKLDILLGGNQYKAKPELGINAASYGQVYIQGQNGTFDFLPFDQSGLFETGEIRDFKIITIAKKEYLIIAKNNSKIATYLLPNEKMK